MSASGKKLRSLVKAASIWVMNNVILFLDAKYAFSWSRVEFRPPINNLPSHVIFLILILQIPNICWQGGWKFVILRIWEYSIGFLLFVENSFCFSWKRLCCCQLVAPIQQDNMFYTIALIFFFKFLVIQDLCMNHSIGPISWVPHIIISVFAKT